MMCDVGAVTKLKVGLLLGFVRGRERIIVALGLVRGIPLVGQKMGESRSKKVHL
jgi:hypothetical protein